MKIGLDINQLIGVLDNEYGLAETRITPPDDGIEGATYIISGGGQKFVAKIYGSQIHAVTIARFQDLLAARKLPTPGLMKTKTGSLTATISDKFVVLSEYLEGDPIGWNEDSLHIPVTISNDVAHVLAKMHTLDSFTTESKIDHSLSVENILAKAGTNIEYKETRRVLSTVRQVMVHGDLTRENILLNTSRSSVSGIIDFGDVHYDYITYDLAILLTQVYVTKTWGIDFAGIKDFLISYEKQNHLSLAEKESILPLMRLRNQGLLRQIKEQLGSSTEDREILESIKASLETKLELLSKNQDYLKKVILPA